MAHCSAALVTVTLTKIINHLSAEFIVFWPMTMNLLCPDLWRWVYCVLTYDAKFTVLWPMTLGIVVPCNNNKNNSLSIAQVTLKRSNVFSWRHVKHDNLVCLGAADHVLAVLGDDHLSSPSHSHQVTRLQKQENIYRNKNVSYQVTMIVAQKVWTMYIFLVRSFSLFIPQL